MKKTALLIFILAQFHFLVNGQDTAVTASKQYKNVFRINPTPMFVFSNLRNFTLCYERLVKKNQSFVIQAGYLEVKPIFKDSIEGLFSFDRQSSIGMNVAFDYRFYPLNRNKFSAPNGLYFGPYISYYGFKFEDEVTINGTDPVRYGHIDAGFHYINLGFMVGYQFIFWKHFALDMLIFGPSLTAAVTSMDISTDFTEQEKNDMIEELRDKFTEKYPALTPFINIDGNRHSTNLKMFFRYSLSIGYHF